MKLSTTAFFLAAARAVVAQSDVVNNVDDFEWKTLDIRLPKKISDHSAETGQNGLIYIAGGCDSEDGNVYTPIDDETGFFTCDSISSSFYAFNPSTQRFSELAKMPRARYRHSMSIVGSQVWLIGGRDLQDVLIPEIDVYDIDSDSWKTAMLPESFRVSDHAGFENYPYVYIVGGYDQGYVATASMVRINTESLDQESLLIETRASLNVARGDVFGVTATDGLSAFVTGGFTHANGFCAPLGSTEQFFFETNEWQQLPDLQNDRGEVVLVEIDNRLFALGGERQIEGYCDSTTDGLAPGEKTVATPDVEFYDPVGNAWQIISGFPDHKFRFAAAVSNDGTIYAFGGQTAHDMQCQCFRTTDDVQVFGRFSTVSSAGTYGLSFVWIAALALGALL